MKNSMKKILSLLLSLFFLTQLMGASLVDSLQNEISIGNSLYQQGNYESALEHYLKVVDNQYKNSNLYYNIGNTYYKLEELGNAILWYERALLLSPNNADIKHNIAFVNQELEDKIDHLPQLFISGWYNSLSQLFNSKQWAIVSIIAAFSLVASILGYLFIRHRVSQHLLISLAVISLILSILSTHFSYHQINSRIKKPQAIVMSSVITGKSTPDEKGTDLFVIHEGLKVVITDQLNDWVEIQLPNGEKGWVNYQAVEKI